MNQSIDLSKLLKSLYDRSRKLSNKKGLKLINTEMNSIILDFLETNYAEEANKYIIKRDEMNKNQYEHLKNVIEYIREMNVQVLSYGQAFDKFQSNLENYYESKSNILTVTVKLNEQSPFNINLSNKLILSTFSLLSKV